jgi:hypothetical protein
MSMRNCDRVDMTYPLLLVCSVSVVDKEGWDSGFKTRVQGVGKE